VRRFVRSGSAERCVQARVAAREAAARRGDQAALYELDAQFWLDGPEQPTGRVGGAPCASASSR